MTGPQPHTSHLTQLTGRKIFGVSRKNLSIIYFSDIHRAYVSHSLGIVSSLKIIHVTPYLVINRLNSRNGRSATIALCSHPRNVVEFYRAI